MRPLIQVDMRLSNSPQKAAAKEVLGSGLVSRIQSESTCVAMRKAPSSHKSQAIVVATIEGKINRPVRRKAVLAMLDRA